MIKHCRRIATRYDKLAANYLTFVQLASARLWLQASRAAFLFFSLVGTFVRLVTKSFISPTPSPNRPLDDSQFASTVTNRAGGNIEVVSDFPFKKAFA